MWQNQLAPGVQNSAPQVTPSNFSITNSRGGLSLSWSPVQTEQGADGYEILKSSNGSFTDDLQVIPVPNVKQSGFFDSTGGNATAASYRIRTTSGTPQNPQSQRGPESGPIRHISIDATDTLSIPVTKFDIATTDKTRSLARIGNYGAFRQSGLGLSGGKGAGTGSGASTGGTPSTGGSGGGTPPSGGGGGSASGTPFSSITTGENITATMIVGSGAQILLDPVNPGVIDANELQGIPVTTATPANGAVLQYSASGQQLQYNVIIESGTQAGLQAALPLSLGELYVATDTGNLFIGTPGFGPGYIQVGDTTQMNETLLRIEELLKSLKLAVISTDNTLRPEDFEPNSQQLRNGNALGEMQ
jgi:hypothetical protein